MTEAQQMTIWDYLEPESLDNLSESEMVKQIEVRTGLKFEYFETSSKYGTWNCYKAKKNGIVFEVSYSKYMNTNIRFIDVGWDCKKNKSGGGSPCDSVDEAVKYLKSKEIS